MVAFQARNRPHFWIPSGQKMKKYVRAFIWTASVAVLAFLSFFAWLVYDINESRKTDFWNTDAPPDAVMKSWLMERGYPDSVTRVVEVGNSSRVNGDGEKLTVCCFPVADLGKVKRGLGGSSIWREGLPPDGSLLGHLQTQTPKDLNLSYLSYGSDYIHLSSPLGARYWLIIDVRRGISYEYIVRT